jgi:phosphomannomutase/phosphoglucomutase
MVETLATTRGKLSKLIEELPQYCNLKARIPCPDNMKRHVLSTITQTASNMTVETIDGLKIWADEHTWILIRPSGTEPIFRLYAEADTQERADQLVAINKRLIEDTVEEFRKQ